MTTILAIDTATESLSVALWRHKLLAHAVLQVGLKHSPTLMPLVEELCQQANLQRQEITALACTVGPGSFTGIRIGVSTVLGMAYAQTIPALGFSTLAVMARAQTENCDHLFCPVIDARNDRVFAAAWSGNDCVVAEGNWQLDDFLTAAAAAGRRHGQGGLLLAGSGRATFQRQGLSLMTAKYRFAPPFFDSPRADVLAFMAAESLRLDPPRSAPDTWSKLMPRYHALSQAERMQKEKAGSS